MRLAWLTDLHLNYIPAANRESFFASLSAERLDGLLIGGDIGEADSVGPFLTEIESAMRLPIYFVLGNHDFYRGSITRTRAAVSRQAAASPWLRWLPDQGVIPLGATSALIGHDCWGDGRAGDFFAAQVIVNDFQLIQELQSRNKESLLARLNALGDEAAAAIARVVEEAITSYREFVVLTHVPLFSDLSWREGRIPDQALPFYVCKAAGDQLLEIARAHPDRSFTVLSGHTHSAGVVQVLPNLVSYTGAARYGRLAVQRVFDF